MTLFEKLGIEYREENGIQYPVLSVDTEGMRLDNVGKYGRMWAGFMEENEPSRYRHLARLGMLHDIAEEVNEEAYERLDNIQFYTCRNILFLLFKSRYYFFQALFF